MIAFDGPGSATLAADRFSHAEIANSVLGVELRTRVAVASIELATLLTAPAVIEIDLVRQAWWRKL